MFVGKLVYQGPEDVSNNLQKDLFVKIAMHKWDMEFHIPVRS